MSTDEYLIALAGVFLSTATFFIGHMFAMRSAAREREHATAEFHFSRNLSFLGNESTLLGGLEVQGFTREQIESAGASLPQIAFLVLYFVGNEAWAKSARVDLAEHFSECDNCKRVLQSPVTLRAWPFAKTMLKSTIVHPVDKYLLSHHVKPKQSEVGADA